VFDYIDREDSPRPVAYQLDLLRRVGFSEVDLLHKNSCFAAFGGKKGYPCCAAGHPQRRFEIALACDTIAPSDSHR
jgi:hypothetical protein